MNYLEGVILKKILTGLGLGIILITAAYSFVTTHDVPLWLWLFMSVYVGILCRLMLYERLIEWSGYLPYGLIVSFGIAWLAIGLVFGYFERPDLDFSESSILWRLMPLFGFLLGMSNTNDYDYNPYGWRQWRRTITYVACCSILGLLMFCAGYTFGYNI